MSDDARSVYEQTLLEDDDSGTSYRCFVDPEMGVAGVVASRPGAPDEYVYLNPSGGSDDGVATVFVYRGPAGDPRVDAALCHVVVP